MRPTATNIFRFSFSCYAVSLKSVRLLSCATWLSHYARVLPSNYVVAFIRYESAAVPYRVAMPRDNIDPCFNISAAYGPHLLAGKREREFRWQSFEVVSVVGNALSLLGCLYIIGAR